MPSNDSHVSGLGGEVETVPKWRILQVELIWKKYVFTFSHLEFEVLVNQGKVV